MFFSGLVAVLVPAPAAEQQIPVCPEENVLHGESACDDPSVVSAFAECFTARVLGGLPPASCRRDLECELCDREGAAVRGHVHRHEPLAGRAELHRVQLLRRGGSRYSDTHSLDSVLYFKS